MMNYFYLAIALAGGLLKGFAGKKVSRDVSTFRDGVYINLMRCALCAVPGFLLLVWMEGWSGFLQSGTGWLISCASALCTAVFAIAWLYAFQSEAYMFLSVFTMLGSILTGLLGALVYGDPVGINKVMGMVLLVAAVSFMSFYNKKLTGVITRRGMVTLILGALGSALADFMQKVYNVETVHSAYTFSFYTYFLPILPQLLLVTLLKGQERKKMLSDRRHMVIYVLMSAGLYANMLSKTVAAAHMSAALMYPLLQGANLIASAILARILLKEKLTPAGLTGMALALTAIVLMNL